MSSHLRLQIQSEEALHRVEDVFLLFRRDAMIGSVEEATGRTSTLDFLGNLLALSQIWRIDVGDVNGRNGREAGLALGDFAIRWSRSGVEEDDL